MSIYSEENTSRQDPAFYTNSSDYEVVWNENPRFCVIRNGGMNVYYTPFPYSDSKSIDIIRYTNELEALGIKTDEDLRGAEPLLTWHNNSWFEVLDFNNTDWSSDVYDTLYEAIDKAINLWITLGADKEWD